LVRIAYCVLVHKNPRQVARLLNSIYSESDLFYVNVFNANSSKEEWQKEIGSPRIYVNFKYGKSWGEFPVVSATLDAMQKFANSNYDYFVNLSRARTWKIKTPVLSLANQYYYFINLTLKVKVLFTLYYLHFDK